MPTDQQFELIDTSPNKELTGDRVAIRSKAMQITKLTRISLFFIRPTLIIDSFAERELNECNAEARDKTIKQRTVTNIESM